MTTLRPPRDSEDAADRGADELSRFLFRPIAFQQPHRTVHPPSWLEHIPFAFWLVGAWRLWEEVRGTSPHFEFHSYVRLTFVMSDLR